MVRLGSRGVRHARGQDMPGGCTRSCVDRCGLRAGNERGRDRPRDGPGHSAFAGCSAPAPCRVEPDSALADYLRRAFGADGVFRAALEDAELPAGEYDLAVAGLGIPLGRRGRRAGEAPASPSPGRLDRALVDVVRRRLSPTRSSRALDPLSRLPHRPERRRRAAALSTSRHRVPARGARHGRLRGASRTRKRAGRTSGTRPGSAISTRRSRRSASLEPERRKGSSTPWREIAERDFGGQRRAPPRHVALHGAQTA